MEAGSYARREKAHKINFSALRAPREKENGA
jgi:hypothetical protein